MYFIEQKCQKWQKSSIKCQFITKMVEISYNNRLIFLTNALKSKLELENN